MLLQALSHPPCPYSLWLTATLTQLSIYDSPGAPILLVPEAPTALQLQISSVRKAAQSVYSDLSQRARLASDQWIGAEHKLEREHGIVCVFLAKSIHWPLSF